MINLPSDLLNLREKFVEHGFDIRLVGGCVRDYLVGQQPHDLDLCTNANPDQQATVYEASGVRFIDTGLSHGTYTVVLNHIPYEITSLRTETDHDGRHAKVSYTQDWDGDLSRRDLTFNAISMTFDGELIDPYDGATDLRNGVVRFVGVADERMREDYLRILRFFRFSGRFGSQCDMETTQAIQRNGQGLTTISRERVWSEVAKIISGPKSVEMMKWMSDLGLFPHIGLNAPHDFVETLERVRGLTGNPVSRLAMMIGDHQEAKNLASRWKMSLNEMRMMDIVGNFHNSPSMTLNNAKAAMILEHGNRDCLVELLKLSGLQEDADTLLVWELPCFPINGNDLIKVGFRPGVEMGKKLKTMREVWVGSDYSKTKNELLKSI